MGCITMNYNDNKHLTIHLFMKIDAHDNTWNHIIFVERRVEIEVSNDFIGLS